MIKKLFLIAILALQASAVLTFDSNYNKDAEVLKTFDIPVSFLNDTQLVRTQQRYKKEYRTKRFFKAMSDSFIFLPTIKKMIAASDVPEAFLYLAMAESNFSTKAYSHKRASGLWQFMPSTGRNYGLKINGYVDERRDLIKSTEAAINYLTYLHNRFDKWYLAAFAYNCGEGRVVEALTRATIDKYCEKEGCKSDPEIQRYRKVIKNYKRKRASFGSLLKIHRKVSKLGIEVTIDDLLKVQKRVRRQYLPRESRYYIRKIISLSLMANDEKFLINSEFDYLLNRGNAYSLAEVEVPEGEQLSYIAEQLKMNKEDIKMLNRHLTHGFTPPTSKNYTVYIPYIKLAEFKANYKPSGKKSRFYVHRVKRGESLALIGRRYGVQYRVIKDFNRLKSNFLKINQKLIIPTSSIKTIRDSSYKKGKRQYYKIRKGDNLASIARRFGTNISAIKRLNNLSSTIIRAGERLVIYD